MLLSVVVIDSVAVLEKEDAVIEATHAVVVQLQDLAPGLFGIPFFQLYRIEANVRISN